MSAQQTARDTEQAGMNEPHDAATQTIDAIDGANLVHGLRAGTDWLERNLAAVNALNVFPVPDGDTGTNMFLTMKAAHAAAAEGGDSPGRAVGDVAGRAAYGALMGARGNSGVILSQIFRGLADALKDRPALDGPLLAAALAAASDRAYKAVMKPVEGTLLTVSRGAAEAARSFLKTDADADVRAVFDAALAGARATLARTPEMLPLLREAGVVDAGGQGFVIVLEGMRLHFAGRSVETESLPNIAPTAPGNGQGMAFDVGAMAAEHGADDYGYCTNFLITAAVDTVFDFPTMRDELAGMGHSAVIVGDEQYLKAHIHTVDPGALLSYAVRYGGLTQVKIDNMDAQVEHLEGDGMPPAAQPEPQPLVPVGVVAVAAGEGLSAVLRGLGATVIRGGQTMNPSTQEILDAINAAPAEGVIVLPNNGNIVLAARQAAEVATKPVRVVPSKSVPQGIAALSRFVFDEGLDENAEAMASALDTVRTGEVTRAVRDATIGGVAVRSGSTIGLIDDALTVSGDDAASVALDLLRRMDTDSAELVTLYRGGDATEAQANDLRGAIEAAYPNAAVEMLPGGQPHYEYVISVE